MALGLERVQQVHQRLPAQLNGIPLVVIAGTNGKGSTQAFIESIGRAAGYQTATYSSPHLFRFHERIKVNGQELPDEEICAAFEVVEIARQATPLTYFEFVTLAALVLFSRHQPDLIVMEIGLGGRLDAVNILDADVGVITTIGEDHQAWLGTDRESIGFEKAGIMRPGRPLVCGETDPPESLLSHAKKTGALLLRAGVDFQWQKFGEQWQWQGVGRQYLNLPMPKNLLGNHQLHNAATALAAIHQLDDRIIISPEDINAGLLECRLPGRFQRVAEGVEFILDVAHNTQAAMVLKEILLQRPAKMARAALFSVCADKAIGEIIEQLHPVVDQWHVFPLQSSRAAPMEEIRAAMGRCGVTQVSTHDHCHSACEALKADLGQFDQVLVTGSFFTVAEVGAYFGWNSASQ